MGLDELQDLIGRAALVTGGSRGLGLQIAEVLGELGAKVALTARKPDELDAAVGHLRSLGFPEGTPTPAYNASKGAVVNLTRTLANEWAPLGINVNAIAPGYFPTKMTAELDEGATARMAPMNRGGGPEDLKGVAALLASDAPAFITGQTIVLDGGVTAI
jgi:NAD(P)-dependent dehydrogenase (short-subunit alcohol dehydrogenase family)